MQSCRKVLDTLELEKGENASLIMARYVKNLDDKNESKRDLFTAITKAASNAQELYSLAFSERRNLLAKTAASGVFRTLQPLAVGLGNSSVLETGLALNPVYGTPILPGSSIKGITAHYCSEVFGAEDPDYRGPEPEAPLEPAGKIYEALFGKVAPEKEQEAGLLHFYDAWIRPEVVRSAFVTDVMTPHHGSDFADPTPINFLTVKGEFELWIGCRNFEADKEWVKFAFGLTEAALKNYGIGGKIRAGYGKMERVLSPEEIKERERERKRAENIAAGFMFSEGDRVEVICVKVELFKGKEKRRFAFTDARGDKNALRFQEVPKVSEGETVKAKVILTDTSSKSRGYVLKAL